MVKIEAVFSLALIKLEKDHTFSLSRSINSVEKKYQSCCWLLVDH